MMSYSEIPIEDMREYLEYCKDTGVFTWKKQNGRIRPGMLAGSMNSRGYWQIGFKGKIFVSHRIAWAFLHGKIKDNLQIDHINMDKGDNRISNLRLADCCQNGYNSKSRKNSASKYKGVSRMRNRWRAYINKGGSQIHLGVFGTELEAAKAYDAASMVLHEEFSNVNITK